MWLNNFLLIFVNIIRFVVSLRSCKIMKLQENYVNNTRIQKMRHRGVSNVLWLLKGLKICMNIHFINCY